MAPDRVREVRWGARVSPTGRCFDDAKTKLCYPKTISTAAGHCKETASDGAGRHLACQYSFDRSLAARFKMDLAKAVEFDLTAAYRSIQAVRPGMEVLEVSAKTGQGIDRWLEVLSP